MWILCGYFYVQKLVVLDEFTGYLSEFIKLICACYGETMELMHINPQEDILRHNKYKLFVQKQDSE